MIVKIRSSRIMDLNKNCYKTHKLEKVLHLEFEKIFYNGHYIYINTENHIPKLKLIE